MQRSIVLFVYFKLFNVLINSRVNVITKILKFGNGRIDVFVQYRSFNEKSNSFIDKKIKLTEISSILMIAVHQ